MKASILISLTFALVYHSLAAPSSKTNSSVIQAPAPFGAAQGISKGDRLYTSDQTSNTVTVLSPYEHKALGQIVLGSSRLNDVLGPQYINPANVHGMGFSRDGKYITVTSITTNTVTIIRTRDNKIISQTFVGRAPHESFFSPDGKEVWVGDRGTSEVGVVDPFKGELKTTIPTQPGPSKVLFSPDGKLAYVNHILSASVDIIDVSSKKVVDTIYGLADIFASDESMSADGTVLWDSHKQAGVMSVIDLTTRKLVGVVETGAGTNHPNFVDLGDRKLVFVTVGDLNHIKVFEYQKPSDMPQLVKIINSTGSTPHGIWPSPDNSHIYIVNEKGDNIDVVDTRKMKIVDTMPSGQEGNALVYVAGAVPDGEDGLDNLVPGTLGKRIENYPVPSTGPDDGKANIMANIRDLGGLEMFTIAAHGLAVNQTYSVSAELFKNLTGDNSGIRVPLVQFKSVPPENITLASPPTMGSGCGNAAQVLAFLKMFDIYDPRTLKVSPLNQRPM